MAPRPQDDGMGVFGQILVVVVAAVAAYFTWGAALGAVGGTTASMGGVIAAGAAAGAVGSVAGQLTGMGLGMQEGFSWKGVALGAIGGGVTAGLSGVNPLGSLAGNTANAAARAALANAVTQGITVATGLQEGFSWRSVAVSAMSAGAAKGMNEALGYDPQRNGFELGKSLGSGLAASVLVAAARGGKMNTAQVAADVFGNVLSDSLAAANGQKAVPAAVGADERQTIMGYFADGPGDDALRVNGLTFSQTTALRQVGNNPYGLPTSSTGPASASMSVASDSRVVRDFDPDNKWDPDGLVPVGADGSPIAQVARGATGLPTSSRTPATQTAAVPLTAADWSQQAKTLGKQSDQLANPSEWARSNGMPVQADQYQQAANKAYYDGQAASKQALNINVESSRNIPPPTSTSLFAPGWNTGEYSAGTPYASGSRAPDYVSIQLNAYVASAGVSIDLHDGGVYGQWALGRQYPAYTAKPGLSIVAGSIAGGAAVGDTAEFLKGGSWATGAFAPSPIPLIGVGRGVNHSYGGQTAIEIGVSVPPGVGVNPAGYGFELKNFKAK